MARDWHKAFLMSEDPRRLIVRLAVAVMAADGRIDPDELQAAERLDRLGLGLLSTLAREEIERAAREPIDLIATCAGLSSASPQAGSVILAALADIAGVDHLLKPGEIQVLSAIGRLLGLPESMVETILDAAAAACEGEPAREPWTRQEAEVPERSAAATRGPFVARPGPAPLARLGEPLALAYGRLGLGADVSRAEIEAAYRALVERYNPAKVIDLGPEFAILAVRKLAEATTAFEEILASLESAA
jgi:uncharacterized tellurite resistance protein B-like protein